jgi:hypothetical protein
MAWCQGTATTAHARKATQMAKGSCARASRFQFQVKSR